MDWHNTKFTHTKSWILMLHNHLGDTNLSWILHISYSDTTLTDFKNLLAYQVATDCSWKLCRRIYDIKGNIVQIHSHWVPSVQSRIGFTKDNSSFWGMLMYFDYMQLVQNHIFWTILAYNGFLWVIKGFIYKISFNILPTALINEPNLLKIGN